MDASAPTGLTAAALRLSTTAQDRPIPTRAGVLI